MGLACCGFGHREIYKDIKKDLHTMIEYLVTEKGVSVFYTGGMGDFDALFIKTVNEIRSKNKVELILVIPYLTKSIQNNKEFYTENFDEIMIPDVCTDVHYKKAITVRNRWMIDHSQFVVSGVCRDFGGAFTALQYAEKQEKEIIDVYKVNG